MPSYIPTFNLTCNIWHAGFSWNGAFPVAVPGGAPSLSPVCQLYIPPSVYVGNLTVGQTAGGIITGGAVMKPPVILRLPKGTDVRCYDFTFSAALIADLVECPAGTKRLYGITWVDDVHKGFINEYRVAMLVNIYYAGAYPMP
jgi:hypothetical protein